MSYPVSLSQLLTEGPFNDCLNSFIYDSGAKERRRVEGEGGMGWDGMGWDAQESSWIVVGYTPPHLFDTPWPLPKNHWVTGRAILLFSAG